MQMQADWLQDRYDFGAWRAVDETGPSVVGIGFRFRGDELEGWRVHRARTVQVVGAPPATLSVWTPADGGGGLLAVDVYESPTGEGARAQLLRLLGEFQGPVLERESEPGEVAFRAGEGAILFVRGNYTALVRSVEREPVELGPIAARLDQHIATEPETASDEGGVLRGATTPASGAIKPGQRVLVDLDMEGPEEGTWIRFFTRSGRIQVEAGRAWYVAGPGGPEDVSIVAIDDVGLASRAALRMRRED